MDTMITSGQREVVMNVVISSARTAGEEAISELSENGVLNGENSQRIVAQGDKVKAAVKTAVKTVLAELAQNVVGCLKRIFTDRTIELAETDGKETIAGAKDVFAAGIYGATKRGRCKPTQKTAVSVWQMIANATYRQIFGGFGENLKRLCWTESQIVALCRDHRDLLRTDGYATFFLFEGENGGFFVAYVYVYDRGQLDVYVGSLDRVSVWSAEYQHDVVVPAM